MIVTAILNSLTYKKMLNAYKSQDPVNFPHNYEFYVNELNVLMYFVTALGIIYYRKHFTPHGQHWWSKQTFYTRQVSNVTASRSGNKCQYMRREEYLLLDSLRSNPPA